MNPIFYVFAAGQIWGALAVALYLWRKHVEAEQHENERMNPEVDVALFSFLGFVILLAVMTAVPLLQGE